MNILNLMLRLFSKALLMNLGNLIETVLILNKDERQKLEIYLLQMTYNTRNALFLP